MFHNELLIDIQKHYTSQSVNKHRDLLEISDKLLSKFPYAKAMSECIQDPIYHAEGDVWKHTLMVINSIVYACGCFSNLIPTALYHDVHKPKTRTESFIDGRTKVSHPNHSRLGAQEAWFDMWDQGWGDLPTKLKIYWECMWHQKVFHMWTQPDMIRSALTYNMLGNWHDLITFAFHDNWGRICPNQKETDDALILLDEWLSDEGILNHNWDEYSRMEYFENENRSHLYKSQPTQGSNVVLLSGLPGAGKDTYVKSKYLGDIPIISLDDLRKQMKISWNDNQGQLIQAAKEQARVYLRDNKPFVWNSTNITRNMRQQLISLFRQYDAHITIESFYIDKLTLLKQNKNRENSVPESVIMNLSKKWEPPSLLEAHRLKWIT